MPPTVSTRRAVLRNHCAGADAQPSFRCPSAVFRHRLATVAVVLSVIGGAAATPAWAVDDGAGDPRPAERGLPPVTVIPPSDIGTPQLFSVAVARHRLYAATLSGLAQFDGSQWEMLEWPRALYAVQASAERVVAGGPDTLVVLQRLDDGRHALRSLLERLPETERAIGDVRSINCLGRVFFVVTDRALLRLEGEDLRVVDRWRSDAARRGVVSRGRLYVLSQSAVRGFSADGAPFDDDLTRYDASKGLLTVVVDHPLAGRLVGIEGRGLFAVRDGVWRSLAVADGDRLRRDLTAALTLPDGSVALASAAHGVLRLTPDLQFDGALGRTEGLPTMQVESLAVDEDGGLWALGQADLARIELGAPLTRIDTRVGLEGAVNDVARHAGRLHVLTSSGVFVVDAGSPGALRARRLPGISARAWSALDRGDHLLVATAEGVYQVRGESVTRIPGTARLWAYVLAAAPDDPARVFVGSRTGVTILARTASGWRAQRELAGAPRYVRSIVARPGGVLYVGSTFDGVVRLGADGGAQTVTGGETTIRDVGGVIHVLSTDVPGLTVLDESRGTLRPLASPVPVPSDAVRFAFHPSGDLWLSGRGAAVAPAGRAPLRPVLDRALSIQMLAIEPDGVAWLGGASGLWRFAAGAAPATVPRPPTLEHVRVDGRAVTLNGPNGRAIELPHDLERLRVEFSPNTFASTALSEFRLEPLDDAWIPARHGHAAEFTSLREGDYRLRVRTSNGAEQAEATWAFTVSPPWYRTSWAFAGEVVAGVLLLLGVSQLRTLHLQRRSAALEAAVVEQTAALQEANRRLAELAWRDELTGLSNRRHFEEALAEEWARAQRARTPLALVLVDIDHFKALNDTLGHTAGDRALQAVARVIEQCARRPGDVAARYGGDEFAVLLPGGRAAHVHALAEEIRGAVEALALPHPRHPLDHVTVSVGVTALVPADAADSALVDAADRALYRAKAGGRNAVAA